MTATILITGFGPFPGAPYNPTGPLVIELARRRHPAFANVRRVAHIFPVSYEAVDRELPTLLKRERPDALIMFGLAVRAKQIRVEMRARNAITRTVPDVSGSIPLAATILPGAAPRSDFCLRHARPAYRSHSPATPAAISAIICAGGPPRLPAPARLVLSHLCMCRQYAARGAPRSATH
jgi:pyrrolidone-carboxylate peptidase